MDLSKMSLIELKAYFYDLMAQKELIERDMGLVNREISLKINDQSNTSKDRSITKE